MLVHIDTRPYPQTQAQHVHTYARAHTYTYILTHTQQAETDTDTNTATYTDTEMRKTTRTHIHTRTTHPRACTAQFWTSGQWMTERAGGSDVSRGECEGQKLAKIVKMPVESVLGVMLAIGAPSQCFHLIYSNGHGSAGSGHLRVWPAHQSHPPRGEMVCFGHRR